MRAGLVLGGWLAVAAGEPSLVRPGSKEIVPWEQWRGTLVVFDFFAPWCLPCTGVSRELQEAIGQYYRQRGGNARGIPVEVVAVNIDDSNTEATREFLKRAGLESALLDPKGRLFEAWGGETVPFVVVVDGATASTSGPGRLVARYEGHPGTERLRSLLDGLGGTNTVVAPEQAWTRFLGVHSAGVVEVVGEALVASDIGLYQATAVWQEKRAGWDLRLQAGVNLYDLDYEPAPTDLISQARERWEEEWSFQGRARLRWSDPWQAEVQGGLYEGFADYRSIWLDEYYRQYFEGVSGYEESTPRGWNVVPSVRWEAVPASAWLQAGLVIQEDDVSPGYEKTPFRPLVRGTDHLDTLAGTLGLENVLSRRLRSQQNLRITDTTDRDLRYEYSLSLHWSAAQHWVLRGMGGTTLEPPDFHAFQGQVGAERDWNNRWFCGVFGRYYTDDGLVRDPKILSNASPPLETWQAGLVLRHESERWQGKLSAGPYLTRYEPVPVISRHFATLYADRDWLFVQASVAFKF